MDGQNIKEILQIILDSLQGKEFVWRLEGSANLKVQNVDIFVRDLDITTNDEGINIFRNALNRFIVKDFFSQKINGRSLVCDIGGFEVEVNSYGDMELHMFDKTEKISWNNLQIPILPITYAKKFYELINYKEKVLLIEKHLLG
ncbi:MAG TPA: hypothetical protein VJI98_03855 [Candidatus Nanoarchaeia archaeon]|nr:hypothetical protein [Candidatus Nanoarchaeia archaeon]